jgi:hypothetical protein
VDCALNPALDHGANRFDLVFRNGQWSMAVAHKARDSRDLENPKPVAIREIHSYEEVSTEKRHMDRLLSVAPLTQL